MICLVLALAQEAALETRKVGIMSEGVRLVAEVIRLKEHAGKKLPTVILAHGWGGTAAGLKSQATDFARAGYLSVAFDYRGWGESDGRIVRKAPDAAPEVLREYVDPLEQTQDFMNVIHWAVGEAEVDPARIGLWGSSYSGGHVVYVAARDPRVKCTVSQVAAFDSRWASLLPATRLEATRRARGELGYPKPGVKAFGNLTGAPILDKLVRYAPVEDVATAKDCAMLFIDAGREELFNTAEHGKLAHERAKGPKKYVEIPDITHYGIYDKAREQATKLAIEWYDAHLNK